MNEFTGNGYRDLKIGSRHLQSGWFTILPSYYNDGTNEETFSYTPTEGTIKLKANLYGTPKWTEMKVIDYSPASINGEGGFIEVESLLKNANRSTSGVETQIINNTQTTNDSNRYKIQ